MGAIENMDDLQWGRICNVRDLRENTRNSIGRFVTWVNLEWGQIVTWRRFGMRVNCNMANLKCGQISNGDEFEMGVICNMGELQFAPTTCANILTPISMFND